MDVRSSGNSAKTVVLKWKSYRNVGVPKWGCYGTAALLQRTGWGAGNSLSGQVHGHSSVPSWGNPATVVTPKWRVYGRRGTLEQDVPHAKVEKRVLCTV